MCPNLFQLLKIERAVGCPIALPSTMSTRRRRPDATETSSPEASKPKRVRPPEFDTCNFYSKAVNLIFDPKRFLLRSLFFMDKDRTKYVSVGFFPARDYQPFLEFGSVKNHGSTILILDDRQVNKMAECLSRICESMCGNEQYGCKKGDFRQHDWKLQDRSTVSR